MIELDPIVREVFAEVAASPGSKLLNIDPRDAQRAARRPLEPARLSLADLSSAERFLVLEHGEVVASALHRASESLASASDRAGLITPHRSRGVAHRVGSPDEVARSIRAMLARVPIDQAERPAKEQLESFLSAPSAVAPDHLAEAAFRIDPRDRHRVRLAYNAILDERYSAATAILKAVLGSGAYREDRIRAWHGIGLASSRSGALDVAIEAYSESQTLDPGCLISAVSLLVICAIAGSSKAFWEQSRRVDELFQEDSEALDWFVASYAERRGELQAKFSAETVPLLRKCEAMHGASSRLARTLLIP